MTADFGNTIWAVVLISIPAIALVTFLYSLLAVAHAFLGKREKRRQRLKRFGRVLLMLVAVTAGSLFFANYARLAALRRTAYACESKVAGDGRYIVKRCALAARHGSIRVYGSQTTWLLAERTYRCDIGEVDLVAGRDMVFDACGEAGSEVSLPPSLLDWVLAVLP